MGRGADSNEEAVTMVVGCTNLNTEVMCYMREKSPGICHDLYILVPDMLAEQTFGHDHDVEADSCPEKEVEIVSHRQ